MSPRTKSALLFVGFFLGFVLLEVFYFSVAIPFSETFSIPFFWESFLVWFAICFILSAFLTRSRSGASLMMFIAAIIFIAAGSAAEGLPTQLEGIVGPMFPGWFSGLLLYLSVYVARGSSLLPPTTRGKEKGLKKACPSCGAQLLEDATVCIECGYRFQTSKTTLQTGGSSSSASSSSSSSETKLFVLRAAISKGGRFGPLYDLYFTDRRIVAIRIGNFYTGRKVRNETVNDFALDHLLQRDKANNYEIPLEQVKSIGTSRSDFITFPRKSLQITFANGSKKTFSISKSVFCQLKERLSSFPGLSNKILS